MSLKCQVCGKEYYHDGKICQTCEETASNSLFSQSGIDTKKWRCDNFLELKSLPFGCNGIIHKEKLENDEYAWNTFTSIRFDKTEMNEKTINFLRFE